MRRALARLPALPALLAGLVLLGACDAPLGSKDNPVGTPALLAYAAPGTRIVLENRVNDTVGRTRIVAGTPTGIRGAYTGEDGAAGSFYPGCWGCGGDTAIDEDAYRALWPLIEGNRATFLRTAPNGDTARLVITVAGSERIETPAGTFDTWLLDGRVEHLTGPAYSAQVRSWWAPGPGWVVRAKGGDSNGNAFTSEVVEFVLP